MRTVQRGGEAESQAALEVLCQAYWYPVYAFLRRTGRPPADAEDLTQMFFHRLIEERALHSASEGFGRLRSYLLGVLKRLMSDQTRCRATEKRGGHREIVSFDQLVAEGQYLAEPRDHETPERCFDRAWAMNLLAAATQQLRQDFVDGKNLDSFEHLQEFLPSGANATSYREIASRMGVEERVVRLQVHRMRQRYRRLIENAVKETLSDPSELPDELGHLLGLVAG